MKTNILKKNEKQLDKEIRKRKLEDPDLLKSLSNILKKKRGHVFKMPAPNTPVIVFMSGGIDTITIIAILMEEFGLQVYPVYFDLGFPQSKYDKKSVFFFTDYYLKKYPKLFHSPMEISLTFPAKQMAKHILPNSGNIFIDKSINHRRGVPFSPAIFAYNAVHYAISLREGKSIEVNTIFGGILPSNIDWYSYESLTTHRSINLDICVSLNDYSWQYTSLPIEKELGFNLQKQDLISWGHKYGLPLEKTRTCNVKREHQCGVCDICIVRKKAFKLAKVKDNTFYLFKKPLLERVRYRVKRHLPWLLK